MKNRPSDLINVNDNLPLDHQLEIVRRWAVQAVYPVIAATLHRALDELKVHSK
jgi:hypothetical protein